MRRRRSSSTASSSVPPRRSGSIGSSTARASRHSPRASASRMPASIRGGSTTSRSAAIHVPTCRPSCGASQRDRPASRLPGRARATPPGSAARGARSALAAALEVPEKYAHREAAQRRAPHGPRRQRALPLAVRGGRLLSLDGFGDFTSTLPPRPRLRTSRYSTASPSPTRRALLHGDHAVAGLSPSTARKGR